MSEALIKEPLNLLSRADASRIIINGKLKKETKSAFSQYMTPATTASFMASLFSIPSYRNIRLLDPGAGVGSLTSAFVEHLYKGNTGYHIDIDAYEIDSVMRLYLERNLDLCEAAATKNNGTLAWRIFNEDFITEISRKVSSLNSLWPEKVDKYTHCIMNPPYKKISSSSRHRAYLRSIGIETVNLYSAFVALSLLLLERGGYLVAIIPRSFCNGPYYRPFREFMLKHAAIRRIHLFSSRNKAFKEDKVLQENIIVALQKGGVQKEVTISTSTDDTFFDTSVSDYPFREIVREDDTELYIHIPVAPGAVFLNDAKAFSYTLSDIGVQVSTGPVVDYRIKVYLKAALKTGTVPLLYPCHFKGQSVQLSLIHISEPTRPY